MTSMERFQVSMVNKQIVKWLPKMDMTSMRMAQFSWCASNSYTLALCKEDS